MRAASDANSHGSVHDQHVQRGGRVAVVHGLPVWKQQRLWVLDVCLQRRVCERRRRRIARLHW